MALQVPPPSGSERAGTAAPGRQGTAAVSPEDAEVTARANALARAHQAGQAGALPALVELLRPLLRTALYRYRRGSMVLPASLDLSVALGAAYSGLARRGRGIRIRGGTARAYYVGVEASAPAVPLRVAASYVQCTTVTSPASFFSTPVQRTIYA